MKISARSTSARAAEILLYGDIGEGGTTASEFAGVLASLEPLDELTVGLNSQGGDVFDGLAIYNTLANHRAHIVTRCDGLAASAASIVLMAGDEIKAADNSIVMIHRAWTIAMGNASAMEDMASVLRKVDGQLAGIYANRTGLLSAKVTRMMDAETWMTAAEAKRDGFVDSIIAAPRVAAKIDRRRFRNVPGWVSTSVSDVKERHATVMRNLKLAEINRRLDAISRRCKLPTKGH